ncbi:MAG: LuxR C-terminal-related transcriptional regulator [Pseudomonadota bacterium]|nr:LuxR C-terminal-related transcriptional regulator [Pseudomonadota bacterium]
MTDQSPKEKFDSYDEVCRLCSPLFSNTPIDYFDYARYYDSGEVVFFGTSPSLFQKSCKSKLLPSSEELYLFCSSGMRSTILSHTMPLSYGPDLNPARYEKNILFAAEHSVFHRLYLVERREGYYVNYGFGVTNDSKKIFTYYLNALPLLERFSRYFERHVSTLIANQNNKKKIIIPYFDEKKILLNDHFELPFEKVNLNITLDGNSGIAQDHLLISEREKECLGLFSQGYTMRNIADKLRISPRTVEMHMRNIKKKLRIKTKNELMDIWLEYYK